MNDSGEIVVGVVGCGHLGKYHARILSGLPMAGLAGVFDANSQAAAELAAKHDCPQFSSLADLLNATEAVVIATPAGSHFEVVRQTLEAGRHVLVEKPIFDRSDRAESLIEMAAGRNRTFCVGHVERFNPAFRQLLSENPKPRFIEAHRLAAFSPRGTDVDVILDLMIHDIDLVLRLVGAAPQSLDASGAVVASRSFDIVNARISFEDGCVANLTASRISGKRMRKFRVFQGGSYFSLDFSEPSMEMYSAPSSLGSQPGLTMAGQDLNIAYKKPELPECNPLEDEVTAFLHSIRSGQISDGIASARDGLAALKIAEQIKNRCTTSAPAQSASATA